MHKYFFVMAICLVLGNTASAQWSFDYICGLNWQQKQGGYATKAACEAAAKAMEGQSCNGSAMLGQHIKLISCASDGCCYGSDLPSSNSTNSNPGDVNLNWLASGIPFFSPNQGQTIQDWINDVMTTAQALGFDKNSLFALTGNKEFDKTYSDLAVWRLGKGSVAYLPKDPNKWVMKSIQQPTLHDSGNATIEPPKWDQSKSNMPTQADDEARNENERFYSELYDKIKELPVLEDLSDYLKKFGEFIFDYNLGDTKLGQIIKGMNNAGDIIDIGSSFAQGDYQTGTSETVSFFASIFDGGPNIVKNVLSNITNERMDSFKYASSEVNKGTSQGQKNAENRMNKSDKKTQYTANKGIADAFINSIKKIFTK